MHNCCGGHRHGNYCPCCGRRLATVCPCCGGSYWGYHYCVATPWIRPQPMWIAPQYTHTITVYNTHTPGSATSAVQRLAGAA